MPKEYNVIQQEELKQRLMESILKIIQEKGYVHADVESIAKEAGTSKSYLYRLFNSKEELIIKALSQHQFQYVLRYLIKYTKEDEEECLRTFLREIVSNALQKDFEVIGSIYDDLPEDILKKIFLNLSYQHKAMIKILGLENTEIDSKAFGNLLITLFKMLDIARHRTFYYEESLQTMFEVMIESIIGYVKKILVLNDVQ